MLKLETPGGGGYGSINEKEDGPSETNNFLQLIQKQKGSLNEYNLKQNSA